MSTETSGIPSVAQPEIRNGALVFLAGMALAGLSFVVERAIIKAVQNRS
jgi:hypothetical protein